MIEINLKLEPQDYLRAQYLHIRPRLIFKVLGALIFLAAIWAVWYSFLGGGSDELSWSDSILPTAAGYLVLHFFVYLPWKTRRIYRQQKSLQREVKMQFSGAGLSAENEVGRGLSPWSDYLKWKENEHLFLLYISDPFFHMIPKRLFKNSADIGQLRQLLLAKIGPSTD